jgi:DNA-binding MarR family transcriptional regulator
MDNSGDRRRELEEIAQLFSSIFKHIHKTLIIARKRAGATEHLNAYPYRVIRFLAQNGPLPVTEIGNRLGIAKSNVSVSVNKLVKLGKLERIPSETDRRIIKIGVTEQGKAEMKEIHKAMIRTLAGYFSRLSKKDQKTLNRSLIAIEGILEKLY